MNVKLISWTMPNLDCSVPATTLLELVAYVARVSNPANQNNNETAEKLVKYLIKNKHWSPLEMADVTLEIETTRDIGRQILRHRSFSFQEFSQRYANVEELGFEYKEARLQDNKNRQNSIETQNQKLKDDWYNLQNDIQAQTRNAYKWAIDNGIAKEVARAVLPEGIISTRMYMKGSLRSWIHYCQLRTSNGTQKEHREIAIECMEEINKIFPIMNEMCFPFIKEFPNN